MEQLKSFLFSTPESINNNLYSTVSPIEKSAIVSVSTAAEPDGILISLVSTVFNFDHQLIAEVQMLHFQLNPYSWFELLVIQIHQDLE